MYDDGTHRFIYHVRRGSTILVRSASAVIIRWSPHGRARAGGPDALISVGWVQHHLLPDSLLTIGSGNDLRVGVD